MIIAAKKTSEATSRSKQTSTFYVYGVLALASVALAWGNSEYVMTREVFRALADNTGNPIQADAHYEAVQRVRVWGYTLAPVQAVFRIGLTALVVQMICLISGAAISFGRVFRIAAVAYGATLFGSLLQILWIVKMPASAISRASLGIVPDSVAAWFGTVSDAPSVLYLSLSRVSITSLLWMLLMYWGLGETKKLSAAGAAGVTAATWSIVGALQVGTSLFVQELVS